MTPQHRCRVPARVFGAVFGAALRAAFFAPARLAMSEPPKSLSREPRLLWKLWPRALRWHQGRERAYHAFKARI